MSQMRRWRLAVSSNSLSQLSLPGAASVVRENGYAGMALHIQSARVDRCSVEPTEPAIASAAEACTAAGLSITGLSFDPDPMEPAEVAHAMDLTALARAPHIRLRPKSLDSRPYAVAFDQTVRCCEAYVEAASSRGIKVVLQQHWGTIAPSATQLFKILSRFDARAIGCIYDAGSMILEGYEHYRIGLEVLGPYVSDVHVKNARFFRSESGVWDWEWSPLSDGLIDLRALFRALRDAGYAGWITLQDETVGPTAQDMLRESKALLEQAMDES